MSLSTQSGYTTYPGGFAAIPITSQGQDASVCFIPFPYDVTSSAMTGAKSGPEAILRASRNLELFDSELGLDTFKIGFETLGEVVPNVDSPLENSRIVEAVVKDVLDSNRMPVLIGGDHSLTLGAVRAVQKLDPDIGVLMLDAHPDFFDEYEGTKYGHASVGRRIHELGIPVCLAGVRSASRDEAEFLSSSNITMVSARDILESPDALDSALSTLPERLYLSIDLDVMDPGEMPAVGTPEPGGLRWYDLIDVLEKVAGKKTIVGFDAVELCPVHGNPAPDFIAAKLIYRLIGLIFRDKLINTAAK